MHDLTTHLSDALQQLHGAWHEPFGFSLADQRVELTWVAYEWVGSRLNATRAWISHVSSYVVIPNINKKTFFEKGDKHPPGMISRRLWTSLSLCWVPRFLHTGPDHSRGGAAGLWFPGLQRCWRRLGSMWTHWAHDNPNSGWLCPCSGPLSCTFNPTTRGS